MSDDEPRCAGCGKVLKVGDDCARIVTGLLTKSGVKETKEWGKLHKSCFHRAIGSPEAVLEEIRQLRAAKTNTTK